MSEGFEILDFAPGLPDDAFAAALDLRRRIDVDAQPELEPMDATELRAFMDDRTENGVHLRYVGLADGAPVALGHLELPRNPANDQLAFVQLEVDPGLDRRVARPLVAHLVAGAAADGRTSVMAFGRLTDAEDADWRSVGLTRRQVERMSVVDLTAVDAGLMQAWVDDGRSRNPDFELVRWQGRCPARHIEAFAAAKTAMSDAPLDELEWNDEVWTPETVAVDEAAWRALGYEVAVLMALTPGGEAAAMTAVLLNTYRPAASWQGDTVVLAAHRGRRIGRWIKAAMWQWLRAERPGVTRLMTGNADSNQHMLAINVAMGYRPDHEMAVWQNDIADLRL